jgi:ATP-binding cassette, subfamily C, bacterial CydD
MRSWPNKVETPISRPKSGLEFLKNLAKQQATALKLSVVFGLLSSGFMIIQWLSLAYLAQQIVIQHIQLVACWQVISVFALSAMLRPVFLTFKNNFAHTASWQARQQVRQHILSYWRQSSPLNQHHHSPAAGATQWVEEVEAMDGYFSQYLPQQMLAVLTPVLILIPVFYLNWLCAVLLLISAPLIPIFMILVGLGAESINQKYFLLRQRLAGHFLDRVKHITTIKLFNAQQGELNAIAYKSEEYRKVVMRTLKIAFLSSTVLEFFTSVAIASVAIYIGFSLFGAITWGPSADLTLFSGLAILLLAPEFFQPLRNLSQFYHDRATALAASNNLVTSLNFTDDSYPAMTEEKLDGHSASLAPSLQYQNREKGLSVVDLCFGYVKPFQAPLNFNLVCGDIMSISGPSGCGKSSLLHTLAGYLSPLHGQIHLPVNNIAEPQVAFLPQQSWLMTGSVLKNILLFNPKLELAELNASLHSMNLFDDIKQRAVGIDSLISDDGMGFSGGQRQRIALLRLLFAPTPLILMDEPTASLDSQNRHRVIEQLQKLAQNAIVIVATHDEEILKIANHHLVLTAPLDVDTSYDHDK